MEERPREWAMQEETRENVQAPPRAEPAIQSALTKDAPGANLAEVMKEEGQCPGWEPPAPIQPESEHEGEVRRAGVRPVMMGEKRGGITLDMERKELVLVNEQAGTRFVLQMADRKAVMQVTDLAGTELGRMELPVGENTENRLTLPGLVVELKTPIRIFAEN